MSHIIRSPKTWTLLAGILLLSVPALANPSGIYANKAGCERLSGKPVTSDNVAIFAPGQLEFWESICPISGVQQVGSGATLVTVSCSGEGETWEENYMIETTSDPDTVILYNSDAPDYRRELKTCR